MDMIFGLLFCTIYATWYVCQEFNEHLTNDDPTPTQYSTPNSNDTTNSKNSVPKLTNNFIAWHKTNCLL